MKTISLQTISDNMGNCVGALINPTSLRRRSLAPLLKRAGLPRLRFHDLLYTCVTLLLSRNVHPKYVQELLGHASIAIALDTYSHVIRRWGIRLLERWRTRYPELRYRTKRRGLSELENLYAPSSRAVG